MFLPLISSEQILSTAGALRLGLSLSLCQPFLSSLLFSPLQNYASVAHSASWCHYWKRKMKQGLVGTGAKLGEEVNRLAVTKDRDHSGGSSWTRNRKGRGCDRPGSSTHNGIKWGEGLKEYEDMRLEISPSMALSTLLQCCAAWLSICKTERR